MGVLRFYSWLKRNRDKSSRSSFLIKKYLRSEVDALFFDFNTLIHRAAQKVYKYGDYHSPSDIEMKKAMYNEYLSDKEGTTTKYHKIFIDTLIKSIENIISTVKPKYKIYIAVDGVVPESKMVQQRQRRYKTAIQSKVVTTNGKTWFDSNGISPGTPLMESIDGEIINWASKKKQEGSPLEIIYSSHLVIGEGEHKIFEYLRESSDVYNAVIYGLDTDLLMLSLLLENKNIFLMRETFFHGESTEYISIEEFKRMMDESMGMKNAHKDFVIIIYLIGNDFVPHMPGLEDRGICIDAMVEIYKSLGKFLHKGDDINWETFTEFITLLATKEKDLLLDFSKQDFKFPLTILNESIHEDELDYADFRRKWYLNAFRPKGNEKILNYFGKNLYPSVPIEDLITDMCAEYCTMISWMYKYYTNGINSIYFNQKYPYYHTPLLYDLASFLNSNIKSKNMWIDPAFDTKKSMRMLPFHQLLYILPPESASLVPKEFQSLMMPGSPLTDYYPQTVETELQGKRAEYESVVYVPMIDTPRIVNLCNVILSSIPRERALSLLSKYNFKENIKFDGEKGEFYIYNKNIRH